ncbi:MAG: 50S ribosomal protein L9 [Candidatus Vogelbacteria bacterium]|nr:50S ribosomal protein L9 [Candidatus Vogelbacteria bacterium]
MKVVFTKDVPRVGRKYEVKEVSDGYGRNFLIKNGLAVLADSKALRLAEGAMEYAKVNKETGLKKIEEYVSKFKNLAIKLCGRANADGHLFAGIKAEEILIALDEQAGIRLEKDCLILPKPIKQIGEYSVELNMAGRRAPFKLVVEAEK